MSQQQQQGARGGPAPVQSDGLTMLVEGALKLLVLALVVAVALPLLVPLLVVLLVSPFFETRARYWVVPRWWPAVVAVGAAAVVALLAVEVLALVEWGQSGQAGEFFTGGITVWGPTVLPPVWPWLVANLAAGVLLVPAVWSWRRRTVARRVRERRVSNVVTQERIERARTQAADWSSVRRIGLRMNPQTGQITTGRRPPRLTAPLTHRQGFALGVVNRATVRGWRERNMDVRRVRDWVDEHARYVLMPRVASAVRALLIAESGTGKTVLLTDVVLCATSQGWPVVMIDAKGDPEDAESMAERVRRAGGTAAVGGGWDLFAGTAEQVTEKLMRLLPVPSGAGQHYIDEARGVLGLVQRGGPVRSVDDLRDRLLNPEKYVKDHAARAMVTAIVDSRTKQTAAGRVLQSVGTALAPLETWLSSDGWTYEKPGADVRIMPLSPVDAAQARLGDLMLADLRRWMSSRLASGDKSPVLVIVDEFPQLVTEETDPGDTASALFETARSAGVGLILAAQSVAGLSNDEARRRRALSSGAALIIGRSKDPEDVVKYAGTVMRMEASGAAVGDELRSGRAQHTYVIPPQDVREAWDGSFWLVQSGAVAPFRALPPGEAARDTTTNDAAEQDQTATDHAADDADGQAEPAPDDATTADGQEQPAPPVEPARRTHSARRAEPRDDPEAMAVIEPEPDDAYDPGPEPEPDEPEPVSRWIEPAPLPDSPARDQPAPADEVAAATAPAPASRRGFSARRDQ